MCTSMKSTLIEMSVQPVHLAIRVCEMLRGNYDANKCG